MLNKWNRLHDNANGLDSDKGLLCGVTRLSASSDKSRMCGSGYTAENAKFE
ncbi:hypothetical protein BN1044_01353 [Hafnia alvei]|uniref:Uncharacterized protein n=1 Tax=Hafnia alvei TaxID=569 RepID=A0A1C6YYC7_HAFAL|nr:hypothetical protein BN1044_01353 [Hafnia alvei]